MSRDNSIPIPTNGCFILFVGRAISVRIPMKLTPSSVFGSDFWRVSLEQTFEGLFNSRYSWILVRLVTSNGLCTSSKVSVQQTMTRHMITASFQYLTALAK